ncbi:MAG: GerMN domain-containing protein [Acidimicrobiales bacterium]
MNRMLFAVAIGIALITAACESGSGNSETPDPDSTQPTIVLPSGKLLTKVWLVNNGRLVAVQREVDDLANETEQAELATVELLSGVRGREAATGFTTQVPEGVQILAFEAGEAFYSVDLSAEFAQEAPEAELAMRLAQVGCSLTQYGPDQLLISVESDIPMMSERVDLATPVTCSMLTTALGSVSSDPEAGSSSEQPPVVAEQGATLDIVFVASGDILNLRVQPGLNTEVLSTVPPTAEDLVATGRTAEVDDVRWIEVTRGAQTGWVHSGFVTESQSSFAEDPRARDMLAELIAAWQASEGGETLVADNGIWIVHFDEPRRFPADQLSSLIVDPTEMQWGSPGCDPDECGLQSFSEAVSQSLIDAYVDEDARLGVDPVAGAGGTPAELVIPTSFANAPYLVVYDSGDDPAADGLDWITWYVYFTYVVGDPRIAGLSIDEWSP